MQKQLAKTESEQAKERLEIIEGLMDQCEELAQQPLSWYEMSQLGLAHDHLFKVAKKLTFDYNLVSQSRSRVVIMSEKSIPLRCPLIMSSIASTILLILFLLVVLLRIQDYNRKSASLQP